MEVKNWVHYCDALFCETTSASTRWLFDTTCLPFGRFMPKRRLTKIERASHWLSSSRHWVRAEQLPLGAPLNSMNEVYWLWALFDWVKFYLQFMCFFRSAIKCPYMMSNGTKRRGYRKYEDAVVHTSFWICCGTMERLIDWLNDWMIKRMNAW